MAESMQESVKIYASRRRSKKVFNKFVQIMGCVVAFVTTYALILPAITLEKKTFCGVEEHIHAEACYQQQVETRTLICSAGSGLHVHSGDCYHENGSVICGQTDYLVHSHDLSCCDADGNLVCTLPVHSAHNHSGSCYDTPEPVPHEHTDTCMADVKGDLICTQQISEGHHHADSCYQTGTELLCAKAVGHQHGDSCYVNQLECMISTEPHYHGDSCYTAGTIICDIPENHWHQGDCVQTRLVCGIQESDHTHGPDCEGTSCTEGHQHTAGCYASETVCTLQEGHIHSASCYERTLNCGKAEGEVHIHGESCYGSQKQLNCTLDENHTHEDTCYRQELNCQIPESEGHTHGDTCYQWNREYVCNLEEGQPEEQEPVLVCNEPAAAVHVHGAECFETHLAAAEPICGEQHEHTFACYQQICLLPEHTHSLQCYSDPDADVETRQYWESTLKNVTLTEEWHANVVAIAESQLGYQESTRNYTVWEDGSMHGYTRYGAWYGVPHGDWCGMFASFCLDYAGVKGMPYNYGVRPWIEQLSGLGLYRDRTEYTPVPGDLVFFDWDHDRLSDHVGIVYEVLNTRDDQSAKLKTIEGNSSNCVQVVTYRLDDEDILGYSMLPQKPDEKVDDVTPEESENSAEPVYYCGLEIHAHVEGCYDAEGIAVCGLTEHQHEENCLTEKTAEPVYHCGLEEHAHSELCYRDGELTCTAAEHTHTEECTVTSEESGAEEIPEWSIPSDLPVMGSVYASGGRTRLFARKMLNADEPGTIASEDPLSLASYLSGATLYYRADTSEDWKDVTGAVDIPGDADFKLTVAYEDVPITNLLNADGKMTYDLPDLLRNAKANGKLTSGSTEVGIITVNDGTVTLAFLKTWLREQQTLESNVIDGDFYVEAEVDLTQVPGDGEGKLVIGNVEIEIDFDDNLVAKYGNVDLVKTVATISEEEDGDYLSYTLTVTAGQDGCPAVTVVDAFAASDYIQEYVGVPGIETSTAEITAVTETGGTGRVYIGAVPTEEKPVPDPAGDEPDLPGTLVWRVGDMGPNETRTLTYRIRLDDNYTGIKAKGNIQNTADVYSQTYKRDSDTATFTPSAGGTMSKMASEFVPNASGGGSITYTVMVKAFDTNSYTLDNVKIMDALDGSVEGNNQTNAAIRKYLSYDQDSFRLFAGGNFQQNGSAGLTEIPDGGQLVTADSNNDGKLNDSFTYYVGSLEPGESKTLTYTLHVDAGVFVEAGNSNFQINNRSASYTDDKRIDGDEKIEAYNSMKTINRKAWSRKLVGEKQDTETTVNMTGDVYDITGDAPSLITNPESGFTAPAGSYRYRVVLNEAGDWDMSSASLKDHLDSEHMEFTGYLRVDAYAIGDDPVSPDMSDAEAADKLAGMEDGHTVWLKIDGQHDFEFSPKDIGLTDQYAYLLTYYAIPVNTEGITQVAVSNHITISGDVVVGNVEYRITGINVSSSVIVEGSNTFAAEKLSWYYEPPTVSTGDFSKGAMYWVIKLDGNVLPAHTQVRDLPHGGSAHYFRGDSSLVGVYTGSSNLSFAETTDINDLTGSNQLTALDSSSYTAIINWDALQLNLTEDLPLAQAESLYIIVKTEPSELPQKKRDVYTFQNKLQTSSGDGNWLDHNTATEYLYGSENIFKELGGVFTYNGTGYIEYIKGKGGTQQGIHTDALGGTGTFVAWQIHLNYEGGLSGRYRVIEQIPEGMEVAYIRLWWLGNGALKDPRPVLVPISQAELDALGGGWTAHAKYLSSNNADDNTNYYYTKGQQAIFDVDNLFAGGGERDTYAVEIQLVCRVTDPELLLGCSWEKSFNNVVSLQNADGETIGSDRDEVYVGKSTLTKVGTYNPDVNGGSYPFRITLNELGEDLIEGSETITLVDEMSSTLILDTDSIRVVNSRTVQPVTDWTASVEGRTLKIVLPDKQPLTVTYEASVNAAPGQQITISNNAHWEGYATTSNGKVEVKEFSYAAGGTVGTSVSPSVTVRKLDQYSTSTVLPDASFTLEEGTYVDGIFQTAASGLSLQGTTGEEGTLTFGRNGDAVLKYNTVYRLTETQAPDGYVLDSTPHYFAVAKQNEDGTYPTFPDGVTVWYQSANYVYQCYNHKGEASIAKGFRDAGGNDLPYINGIYRFGIYAEENPTGNPLQTATVKYEWGMSTPANGMATFTNLTLGGTYYLYELDDSGRPIAGDTVATINRSSFLVTYPDGNQVTVPADGSVPAAVSAINRVSYPELPKTGGAGTNLYTMGGILLMVSAGMLLLYIQSKRRKEASTSS